MRTKESKKGGGGGEGTESERASEGFAQSSLKPPREREREMDVCTTHACANTESAVYTLPSLVTSKAADSLSAIVPTKFCKQSKLENVQSHSLISCVATHQSTISIQTIIRHHTHKSTCMFRSTSRDPIVSLFEESESITLI
jgi:hypothetical protein